MSIYGLAVLIDTYFFHYFNKDKLQELYSLAFP